MEKPRWAEVRKIMALGMRALGRAVIGAAAARDVERPRSGGKFRLTGIFYGSGQPVCTGCRKVRGFGGTGDTGVTACDSGSDQAKAPTRVFASRGTLSGSKKVRCLPGDQSSGGSLGTACIKKVNRCMRSERQSLRWRRLPWTVWLRRERERIAIGRRQVADRLGLPESQVIRVEINQRLVPPAWFVALAELGFPVPAAVLPKRPRHRRR